TTLHPYIVEVGGSDRNGRVGRMVRIVRRPEVAAGRRCAAVPELELRDRVPISIGGGKPILHLMPLVVVQTLIRRRNDRRMVWRNVRRWRWGGVRWRSGQPATRVGIGL